VAVAVVPKVTHQNRVVRVVVVTVVMGPIIILILVHPEHRIKVLQVVMVQIHWKVVVVGVPGV
jgi:hypothetical protein